MSVTAFVTAPATLRTLADADDVLQPAYTGRLGTNPVPAAVLPASEMAPQSAYRFIHDELMLDGSSRLNLATFVTTWMDPEAERLMAETFDKNMIDVRIMSSLRDTATWLSGQIASMDEFELVSDGKDIPVFAFHIAKGLDFDVFDVLHELRARGWQVPAYTMPADATHIAVLRVVVREGFSGDLGRMMLDDLRAVVATLHERGSTGSDATHFAH